MVGVKLKIHPLFYVFGVFYAISGRVLEFVIYTVCAVIHELGHSIVASNMGYALNKITLMPFGAVVSGSIEDLKVKDELKIALAGPLTNLGIGLLCVAVWWIFPEIYAFTDTMAEANFSLALINLLPVFPLDGGRVLSSFLCRYIKKDKAYLICKSLGIAVAVLLLGLFVFSVFYKINFSLLFFSTFILFGALDKHKENKYVKVYSSLSPEKLISGANFKKQGIDKRATVKKMISILDSDSINEIVVFDNGEEIAVFNQQKINKIIESGSIYTPIYKFL